jgi:hypothetical protein
MSEITIYRTFYDMQPYHIGIDTALERIRSGKSRQQVEYANATDDPKEFSTRKKQLPCIIFAGKFERRAINGLIEHSGFICLDYDKFPDSDTLQVWRDTLEADEYTYCVFTSPSGRGLKRLVRVPIPKPFDSTYLIHKAYFRSLQAQYECPYFDANMFDVSRICFESYDPELQINPDSRIWEGLKYDPPSIQVVYNKASLSEQETVRRLLLWAERKYPIVIGYRNANLYRLCCSFNDFGINYDHAFSVCSQFQSDDFKLSEIETTLKSAYRKTNKFGTLKF